MDIIKEILNNFDSLGFLRFSLKGLQKFKIHFIISISKFRIDRYNKGDFK
jgi:hypothetical protein